MAEPSHLSIPAALFGLAAIGLSGILSAQGWSVRTTSHNDVRLSRTPDGRPNLQGTWNNSTQTPLQRPVALGMKQFYTDEELAHVRPANHDEDPAQGDPGTYNQFWWEQGAFLSPLYEYACHEGNYSVEGMLRGARAREKKDSEEESGQCVYLIGADGCSPSMVFLC